MYIYKLAYFQFILVIANHLRVQRGRRSLDELLFVHEVDGDGHSLQDLFALYTKGGINSSPLQYIVSLQSFIVGVNHPFTPPPPAKPTLMQYYCTTIAQYTTPHHPPARHHTISVMAISCKGQVSSCYYAWTLRGQSRIRYSLPPPRDGHSLQDLFALYTEWGGRVGY